MERFVYPSGKARRERDRESKQRATLKATKQGAAITAKHISDAETHSELRAAGKMVKPSTASKKSGIRLRKKARKQSRPIQVVTPKQGIVPRRPLLKGMVYADEQYPDMCIRHRDEGCHESPISYRRDNAKRRIRKLQAECFGKNAPVKARTVPLKPKFPVGHVKYHRTGSVSDQLQLLKGHDPHARPETVSLVRQDVLRLLRVDVDTDFPTRIVPNRYVDKGGVQRVELFEIPVPEYRDPDAVSVDRVSGERPLSDHRAFMISTAEVHKTLRLKRIAKRKVRKAKCQARKAEENPQPDESSNANAYSFKERQAPLRKRFSPEGNGAPACRGVGNKKHQRRTAAMLRDTRRSMDFDHSALDRAIHNREARKVTREDRYINVAKNITTFDGRKATFDAQPVDPVKAGKKAAKLAAFKKKQALRMETGAWPAREV